MPISKTYEPNEIEEKWYRQWLDNKLFHSEPDAREPYTIVIPPPNVTGSLHMGHMLNNTIQDVLVRRARMQGYNACWVPGTDHASIATETKVVNMLREKGIRKQDVSREEFLEHAWEWKEKYGGIILEQLKKLGASCDWDRTRFTMEEKLSASVTKVFVDLHNKGLIYRGYRMVNWDPAGKTALSDEEVIHREEQSHLYYLDYAIKDSDRKITIATTRPESILGDSAICVHPDDDRYRDLVGQKALVPLINREVPIIADEYVTMEFGTGALKVTPAHDLNDYELGLKHKLEFIDILNEDATMNEKAQLYIGEDRFAVRKKIVAELKEKGFLQKVEQITNNVGYSERTNVVIEPRLSLQWFVTMKDLATPALAAVADGSVLFFPSKFKNTYRHWMAIIKDWCISRQLWWGQRIPAWFISDDEYFVAENAEEALKLAQEKTGNAALRLEDLRQEEAVVDTWFSSWLWPISVFDGILNPDNEDIRYYYPTNTLVTAPDIIFFWVARMIMAGYEFRNTKPFERVYFTGIVRDSQGRKMSKQLGNSPDPLDLIKQYGADAMRTGVLFSAPAGNDLLFDMEQVRQGRNFCNKIWNVLRLVKGWEDDGRVSDALENSALAPINWFQARLDKVVRDTQQKYDEFRISEVLIDIYKLIWDDFCSWYLEMVKPGKDEQICKPVYEQTLDFFEMLMKLIHPFMPFISEEIYHTLRERREQNFLSVAEYPKLREVDEPLLRETEKVMELISQIRNIRNEFGIAGTEKLTLLVKQDQGKVYNRFNVEIIKLCKLEEIRETPSAPENAISFMIRTDEFYIPRTGAFDTEAEKAKLNEELKYQRGFLQSVMKKLENERFVNNAPAQVLENEKQKQADAEAKIKSLEESLKRL
ncbi:MAG: valine--tRNA ligase [Bacteroidia bacterium]